MENKIITGPFDIADYLRGDISGDYVADLRLLQHRGVTCTLDNYNHAYQIQEQP